MFRFEGRKDRNLENQLENSYITHLHSCLENCSGKIKHCEKCNMAGRLNNVVWKLACFGSYFFNGFRWIEHFLRQSSIHIVIYRGIRLLETFLILSVDGSITQQRGPWPFFRGSILHISRYWPDHNLRTPADNDLPHLRLHMMKPENQSNHSCSIRAYIAPIWKISPNMD